MYSHRYVSYALIILSIIMVSGCRMMGGLTRSDLQAPAVASSDVTASGALEATSPAGLFKETETPTVTSTPTLTPIPTLTATLRTPQTGAAAAPKPVSTQAPVVVANVAPPTTTFTSWPTPTTCPLWLTQPPLSPVFDDGTVKFPLCATAPITTSGAAQYFEGGVMLWLKNPGVYFLLNGKGDAGGSLFIVHDPLTVYRDTSAQYVAPAGLYAPVSGFGLVWRGDYLKDNSSWEYEQLLTYRRPLGWATAPEAGYQTTYQCGSYANTVMLKPIYCLLSYSDGRPILIEHSLGSSWGGWKFIQ